MRTWLFGMLLAAAGTAVPAQARWLRAETPNFVLYSEGSEAGLRAYAAVVEDYDALLRTLFRPQRLSASNKLTVYLVRNASDLLRFTKLPAAALGVYTATPGGTAAFAVRGREGVDGLDGQQVLLHEYAHHFMLQYFPANYPRWFVEGFAEYLMTASFKPGTIEFGAYNKNRTTWLVNGIWLPIGEILNGDTKDFSGDRNAMFYAQSWLMVHYFYRDPARNAAFQTYLTDTLKGRSPDDAFKAAFHMTYNQMSDQLHRYLEGRMTYSRLTRKSEATPVAITVTTLPPAADTLLLEQARLTVGVDEADRASLLAAVRRDAAKFPGDPFATRVAAQAEIKLGERAAGEAMLDTLLAGDGKSDPDVLYLRGLSQLLAARQDAPNRAQHIAAARPFFAKAHKLDPNQYQSLYRYGETFLAEGGKPSDNTANIMLLAHDLAPQVDAITVDTARVLWRQDRVADARILLEPVAHSPHGGEQAGVARAMLDRMAKPGEAAAASAAVDTAAPAQ